MTYTEKELDQFLHGISLSLLSKKSAQHWRYDEETAKEIEWLEALERKVRADKADRKTEPNCSEKPNNCEHITEDGVTCAKYPACDDCLDNPLNKVKGSERLVKSSEQTEPTISKMEQVDKDINVRSKDELMTKGVWNAGYKTGYDKGYKDAQKVKDSQDLVKELVKTFCEDGTWLERQGVYTLTLAEAKQRAVDIIESITQTETQNSNLTFEKRTMLDCYNCKRFETGGECIECRYETKDEPQTDVYEYHDGEWVKPDCPWK